MILHKMFSDVQASSQWESPVSAQTRQNYSPRLGVRAMRGRAGPGRLLHDIHTAHETRGGAPPYRNLYGPQQQDGDHPHPER